MERLWSADGPVAATTLRDELGGGLALTTVHTVLSRLEQKGFVVHDGGPPRRFRPKAIRGEHAAELMHEVPGQAGAPEASLVRAVGRVPPAEARMLRGLLAPPGDA